MAAGGGLEYKILVRFGTREPEEITINRTWTVKQLKQHVVDELGITSGEVDLIFSGKNIDEDARIEDLELGEGTVLNAAKSHGMVPNYPMLSVSMKETFVATASEELLAPRNSRGAQAGAAQTKDSRQCFYVYCRRKCQKIQPAKLRVRCSKCKLGQLIVDKDPESWDDVLTQGRIEGECRAPNCDGKTAEFFFKCSGHVTEENESLPPLRMVVTNTRNIPCIVCFDNDREELYVFDCPDRHTICLDCLRDFFNNKIRNRNLVHTAEYGYTLPCIAPKNACKKAYITNPHAFKIVGEELYNRYQFFATQEFVLQGGGVLCPAPNCGFGILPEQNMRRIKCPECKFVFCCECKQDYHGGKCDDHAGQRVAQRTANDPAVSPEHAKRARLAYEAYRTIDNISKPCPRCRAKIDKYSGCNHVTCKCGFEFCWLCLVPWSLNCQRNHWFRPN